MRLSEKAQIWICKIVLALSILFLVIGVDYLPCLVCWIPFIVAIKFTFNCIPFAKHLGIIDEGTEIYK